MTTYEEARELLLSARKQENGKVHPGYRKARMFWEDNEKKKNIVVYFWNGNRGGSAAEARRLADDSKWRGRSVRLLTLRPDGTIQLFRAQNGYWHWHGIYEAANLFVPWAVCGRSGAIHPDAGPKPKKPKALDKEFEQPKFVAKDGYGWAEESRQKARERYEQGVAKYGSLEAWFEAWDKWRRIRDRYEKRLEAWQEVKRTPIFEGMVIDQDGVAQHRSLVERNEARLRREKRERDAADKSMQAEYARQRAEQERAQKKAREAAEKLLKQRTREWEKSIKNEGIQKAIENLPENVRNFLINKKLIPNEDGTVTVFKYVTREADDRYISGHDGKTAYIVGRTTEDPHYLPTPACGHGLHFGANEEDCAYWRGRAKGDAFIACKVPLNECVVVPGHGNYEYVTDMKQHDSLRREGTTYLLDDQGNYVIRITSFNRAKLKARSCVVLGEADPTTHQLKAELTSADKKKRVEQKAARGAKKS